MGEEKKSPVPALLITAVIVGALSGGLYWWKHRVPADAGAAAPAPTAAAAPADPNAPAAAPGAPVAPAVANAGAPGTAAAGAAAAPIAAQAPAGSEKLKAFTVHLHGALESAIVEAVGKQVGAPLTQVVNRSLVWWLHVPADLAKNDTLSVVYEARDNQEPLVHAVRLQSGKLGKTFEAYRFHADGEKYAHFYAPDGVQLELQLVDGPLDEWEQITSLLKDGRKHQGVDFKTPSGSPVRATFDGVIARKTWSFGRNGNSLDVEETGGKHRHALYLHLSDLPKSTVVGMKVKKGEVIAQSGNTGHSFAPHLHYQMLDGGGKLLDPFESHAVTKATIEMKAKPKLDAAVARLGKLIDDNASASRAP
ncbi:MAG: M23 family metallopeptidase [Archangiaceae bacterium]|nr:M23 family metallopeptidase [Archangiaceae bacterium]